MSCIIFLPFRGFSIEEEIMFQVLLLLLLASSRIGRLPVNRGTLLIVLLPWLWAGGFAWLGSHGLMVLTIETPIPAWRAYSYAFLLGMTWMSALFLWVTFALCQRHITGKNHYYDVHLDFRKKLKEKGLALKTSTKCAVVVLLVMIFLVFQYCWEYYVIYYGAFEWTVHMLDMSLIGGLHIMGSVIPLFQCRNYLKSVGKLA